MKRIVVIFVYVRTSSFYQKTTHWQGNDLPDEVGVKSFKERVCVCDVTE